VQASSNRFRRVGPLDFPCFKMGAGYSIPPFCSQSFFRKVLIPLPFSIGAKFSLQYSIGPNFPHKLCPLPRSPHGFVPDSSDCPTTPLVPFFSCFFFPPVIVGFFIPVISRPLPGSSLFDCFILGMRRLALLQGRVARFFVLPV